MTLSAKAACKTNIHRIESYVPEVMNSSSIDLEWISYKGKYEHGKTKIFAAAFCTNWGERIVLHINNYSSAENPEKELINDILFYFKQFPLTFGWYTTGRIVYDKFTGERIRGRDSDFFILHQRCLVYNIDSPFEVNDTYVGIKKNSSSGDHIDLFKIFEKAIIKENVFGGKYRTTGLEAVSLALLGAGKYDGMDLGMTDLYTDVSVNNQQKYVRRDAELVMSLAQYNNSLVLRLMKVFSKYAEMNYFKVCHTNVSAWYENKYLIMIFRGECSLTFTPNYTVQKEKIGGGHHTVPKKGFFIDTKIYELDVRGMYPSIVIKNNISFDTLNCTCCEYDLSAEISQSTIDIINQHLQENRIDRWVSRYWICRKRKGAFPIILKQILSDRDIYLELLKQEKSKDKPDDSLIQEYDTHQIGAKLFANAGFGLFAQEYFRFTNYKVAECITGEGRRLHKQMESLATQNGFDIVFGFTDSIFVRIKETINEMQDLDKVRTFITRCKEILGINIELKNILKNSIFYGKKNRFAGISINHAQEGEPIIKGLDGIADSNPLWIRKWFNRIVIEMVKNPHTRFLSIFRMLREAVAELEQFSNKLEIERELKFTQRLRKYPYEYHSSVRTGVLANLLGKDKGEEVFWFEVLKKDEKTNGTFSIKTPSRHELNLRAYKSLLLDKLCDTLKISGIDLVGIKLELIQNTLPINSEIYCGSR